MSGSFISVAINYPVSPPEPPLSSASAGGETSATTPTADLLDNAAIRLLAVLFLLLAKWDVKQKNRNSGPTLPTPRSTACRRQGVHQCLLKNPEI
jgi:hypothetical protein